LPEEKAMSVFKDLVLPCPACGKLVKFEAVSSVNADRAPELRDEILAGTFQRQPCSACGVAFRLDPEFTYLDLGRNQWIAVHPFGSLGAWEAQEAHARAAFDRSFGPNVAGFAKKLGAGLKPRVTFGWAALKEKILAAEHGLDDLELELTKMAVLRSSDEAPVTAQTELRLAEVKENELIMTWIVAETGEVAQALAVPRDLYTEIAADRGGWQPLRDELAGKFFVDMQRLMLPVAA
jgi:hypothetical protein